LIAALPPPEPIALALELKKPPHLSIVVHSDVQIDRGGKKAGMTRGGPHFG
jgi:hypothetical protein